MRTSPKQAVISLSGTKLRETDKAVLFQVTEVSGKPIPPKQIWFPFSQVVKMSWNKSVDNSVPNTDVLVVSEWIAGKTNLLGTKEKIEDAELDSPEASEEVFFYQGYTR